MKLQSYSIEKAGWIRDNGRRDLVNAKAVVWVEGPNDKHVMSGLRGERIVTMVAALDGVGTARALTMAFTVRNPADQDNMRIARKIARSRFDSGATLSMRLDLALGALLRHHVRRHCRNAVGGDFGADYDLAQLLLPLAGNTDEEPGRIISHYYLEDEIRPWDIASWCRVFFLNGIPRQPEGGSLSMRLDWQPDTGPVWNYDPLGAGDIPSWMPGE